MSSMAWPFSSFFSISTMSLTPSTTICTCSTSEKPSRSALEMSNTAPTASVSTPPGGHSAMQLSPDPTAVEQPHQPTLPYAHLCPLPLTCVPSPALRPLVPPAPHLCRASAAAAS
uniref:Uncharacterized protein n=1 Tax=Gopherus evgoodei TaxID=1825980 RepID=A0A8C4Y787_9SAUR